MNYLVTAAEMREIEAAAMRNGRVTGLELMERAGQGAVEVIFRRWPSLGHVGHTGRSAMVLCGPGNNGGDGFVVARTLHDRRWEVTVFQDDTDRAMSPDAEIMRNRWLEVGRIVPVDRLIESIRGRTIDGIGPVGYGLFVDAGFGIGLSRPVPRHYQEVFAYLNTHRRGRLGPGGDLGVDRNPIEDRHPGERYESLGPIVALDMPSGISADTGRIVGDGRDDALRADMTVSFGSRKIGQYLSDGLQYAGEVRNIDIGLRWSRIHGMPPDAHEIVLPFAGILRVRAPTREEMAKPGGHKFDYGSALILSGGVGRGGAARLAARAALRIGAGLVTIGCPPAALIENAAQLNAVMLTPVRDAAAMDALLKDDRLNALCLGPGFGTTAREAALLETTLSTRRATVIDGDAITLLANAPHLLEKLHADCILTPHDGEFARLFPDLSERMKTEPARYSRIDAVQEAYQRYGAHIVLKGPDTVISHKSRSKRDRNDSSGFNRRYSPFGTSSKPSLHAIPYDDAVPWLATAGAGDVLAGMITGLLARGFPTTAAAEAAVWLHADCARRFGPGLISEDLPDLIPGALADLKD